MTYKVLLHLASENCEMEIEKECEWPDMPNPLIRYWASHEPEVLLPLPKEVYGDAGEQAYTLYYENVSLEHIDALLESGQHWKPVSGHH